MIARLLRRLWLRYLDARIAAQRLAHRDAIHCLLRRPGAETRSRYIRSHVALTALERARERALR